LPSFSAGCEAAYTRRRGRARGGRCRRGDHKKENSLIIERLCADWSDYAIVEVTQTLVERAGEYADTFALRAYDSVQLAAAAHILSKASPEPVQFACFDRHLSNAARILSLEPPFAAGAG